MPTRSVRRLHTQWTPITTVTTPFVPTDITGLTGWWDATNAGSITSSGSPAKVSQWNDLSGNGHHVEQGTGANQPSTGVRSINSLNAIGYAANLTLQVLAGHSANAIFGSSPATALYVFVRDDDPQSMSAGANAVLESWGTHNVIGDDVYEPYTDGHVYHGWGSTVRKDTGDPTPALTTARQITIKTDTNLWSYAIDGSVFYTTGTNTIGWANTFSRIGHNFAGAIGEVLMYNSILAGTDLTNAQGYLKGRWGDSLMAWAYFQNQAAFDAYSDKVCADQQIPRAGYLQSTQAPAVLNCWTDAWVEPIQLRGQGNVTTWAAHIPDEHLTAYDPQLGLTTTDDQVIIGTGSGPTGNGVPVGTVIVQGQSYTLQPNTLTYRKAKPATWTDPKTGITYSTTTGLPV